MIQINENDSIVQPQANESDKNKVRQVFIASFQHFLVVYNSIVLQFHLANSSCTGLFLDF